MSAPPIPAGDVVVLATRTVDASAWRTADANAEHRYELEEQLAAQARAAGRELRDDRGVQLVWLKVHRWTDQETGRQREWREQATAPEADLVEVLVTAWAYRP